MSIEAQAILITINLIALLIGWLKSTSALRDITGQHIAATDKSSMASAKTVETSERIAKEVSEIATRTTMQLQETTIYLKNLNDSVITGYNEFRKDDLRFKTDLIETLVNKLGRRGEES